MSIDLFGMPTVVMSSLGDIEMHALVSESPQFNTLVTENPVEDGSRMSDHVVNQPMVLQLEGLFTDTPVALLDALAAGAGGLLADQIGASDAVAGLTAVSAGVLLRNIRPGLSKTKFKLLVALQTTREPFEVVTGLDIYTNMVFESLSARRAPEDGKSLRFTATLREVRIIGSNTVTNRERIVEELWATALSPEERGVVGKARRADPTLDGAL